MAPMPTLSSTIQMIRENTNFDCNMRLEWAAKEAGCDRRIGSKMSQFSEAFPWNKSLTASALAPAEPITGRLLP
jgi:hypothetical protein